jgi:hypothetical protein
VKSLGKTLRKRRMTQSYGHPKVSNRAQLGWEFSLAVLMVFISIFKELFNRLSKFANCSPTCFPRATRENNIGVA